MDPTNLADLYGAPLLDWGRIEARLEQGMSQAPETGGPNRHTCWLATINHGEAHKITDPATVAAMAARWPRWVGRLRSTRAALH